MLLLKKLGENAKCAFLFVDTIALFFKFYLGAHFQAKGKEKKCFMIEGSALSISPDSDTAFQYYRFGCRRVSAWHRHRELY